MLRPEVRRPAPLLRQVLLEAIHPLLQVEEPGVVARLFGVVRLLPGLLVLVERRVGADGHDAAGQRGRRDDGERRRAGERPHGFFGSAGAFAGSAGAAGVAGTSGGFAGSAAFAWSRLSLFSAAAMRCSSF